MFLLLFLRIHDFANNDLKSSWFFIAGQEISLTCTRWDFFIISFWHFFYSIGAPLAKKEMEKRSHTIKESNFAFEIFNWNKILQLQALVFSRALVDQGVLFKQQVPVTFWPDWSKYSYFKYRALPLLLSMLLFRFLVLTESWSQSWSNAFLLLLIP